MTKEAPLGSQPPLPGFHFLVPVWGAAYCALFSRISLPSQLASGNLPSLPHRDRSLYHILTRAEDVASIESSEAWRILQALMPVRIDVCEEQARTPHETMSAYLRRGIGLADNNDAASLFFNPDLVFANGTIKALVERVKAGRRVVFTTGIRLLKETVTAEIERGRDADGVILLAPRDLAAIAMRNLHPLSRQNFWTNEQGTMLPATLFWPVEKEGLIARCFHLHPLLVWPERKHVLFDGTVDDDYVSMACPDASTDHVVTDSDELLICEISDSSQVVETSYRNGSIGDVVDWAEFRTDSRHRQLATFPIHFHATAMTESLWAPVEESSASIMEQVLRQLDQNWMRVFFRSPTRLFRRWLQRAATASISERNLRRENTWRSKIAVGYLNFYRRYSIFCAHYENLRHRLDAMVFGSDAHPYPWNGRWFTCGRPARAALELGRPYGGRTLIIAPSPKIRCRLAKSLSQAEIMEWPQTIVDVGAEVAAQWPYADGTFDLVVCVGALKGEHMPSSFLAELARIIASRGHAVLVTPSQIATDLVCRRISLNEFASLIPGTLQVEQCYGLGGMGSTLAEKLHDRIEDERPLRRISPVVLEIPILPVLFICRFLVGCIVALTAGILDFFDRTHRFRTFMALVLLRSEREL